MKKLLLAVVLAAAIPAHADVWNLSGSWTVGAPGNPAPSFEVETRVNGGTATAITGLPAPTFATTVNAAATGDTISARGRECNTQPNPDVCGPWTAWVDATTFFVPALGTGFQLILSK